MKVSQLMKVLRRGINQALRYSTGAESVREAGSLIKRTAVWGSSDLDVLFTVLPHQPVTLQQKSQIAASCAAELGAASLFSRGYTGFTAVPHSCVASSQQAVNMPGM